MNLSCVRLQNLYNFTYTDSRTVVHIAIEAYGRTRFNETLDPCKYNISSLCPLTAESAVQAFASIPISPTDIAGLPSIALGLPDLEGFARIQIFANSTESDIGCFQAVLTNGQTFSQPKIVGSLVGAFVFLAALASAATSIYGVQLPHVRVHYAHSFSVLVIFETFQSIYLSGALNLDWPSVLPGWWSNFAWTTGIFGSTAMIDGMADWVGIRGNASQAGGAGSVVINNGGGLTQQIYRRAMGFASKLGEESTHVLSRRTPYNASDPYDYAWGGNPARPGLPTPGDFRGFAGTLSMSNIPLKEAFVLGLIWVLVVLAFVVLCVSIAKLILSFCIKQKYIKADGFDYFRTNWITYLWKTMERTIFIAFFVMTTLCMVQFSTKSPAGPTVLAVIVFAFFVLFMGANAYLACRVRVQNGKYTVCQDIIRFEAGKIFKHVPFIAITWDSSIGEEEQADKPRLFGSLACRRIKFIPDDPNRPQVDRDLDFIRKWGWLWARYQRSQWWFFCVYLVYQFVRACFIGGASGSPVAQVFGLFATELIAFVVFAKMNPFEGARNTTAAVWLLSISKVFTTGVSIAFLPTFEVGRVATTILGIVILVVQAFMALSIIVLIIIGFISTWMSLSRNREEFPEALEDVRVRYFERMEKSAGIPTEDTRPRKKEKENALDELSELSQTWFNSRDVRRTSNFDTVQPAPRSSGTNSPMPPNRRSRANSASSRYSVNSLPRSGRAHRASWTAKDFSEWDAEMNRGDQARLSHVRNSSIRMQVHKAQSSRPPMTPTRESAEFIRFDSLDSKTKDGNDLNGISEAGESSTPNDSCTASESSRRSGPSKRKSVTFADENATTSGNTDTIKEDDKEDSPETLADK